MKKTLKYWWLVSVLAAFLLGTICGSAFLDESAEAAQTFGPDKVKSVPDSFLQGGDRSAKLLSEILTVLRENTAIVKKIESNTRDTKARPE